MVAQPHMPTCDLAGLDPEALTVTAARLRSITAESLGDILRLVPTSWPVADDQLVALGYFLLTRLEAHATSYDGVDEVTARALKLLGLS
jgi:hypothetical protein